MSSLILLSRSAPKSLVFHCPRVTCKRQGISWAAGQSPGKELGRRGGRACFRWNRDLGIRTGPRWHGQRPGRHAQVSLSSSTIRASPWPPVQEAPSRVPSHHAGLGGLVGVWRGHAQAGSLSSRALGSRRSSLTVIRRTRFWHILAKCCPQTAGS